MAIMAAASICAVARTVNKAGYRARSARCIAMVETAAGR